jgi:hypothetical protein
MIELSVELVSDLRQHSVNVPDYILDKAVEAGAHRFFSDTEVWLSVQQLSAFSDQLIVFSDSEHNYITDVKTVVTENGKTVGAMYRNGMLYLDHVVNGEITVTFIVAPVSNSTTVPDWILPLYKSALVGASLHYLKAQQGQDWFDPDGANYHNSNYMHHMGEARIKDTPHRVRFTPFV